MVLAGGVCDSPDPHDNSALFSQAQSRTATRRRARDPGPVATPHHCGGGHRQRFLTELTLDPPSATSDEVGVPLLDEDYLILSTIHSAKGQEWKSVFILNCVDGCVPSDLAVDSTPEIEEERRLLYVAMTRAKDHLQMIVPQRFYAHQQRGKGDRHMYAVRTRFIPDTITDHFEQCAWPPPAREVGPRPKAPTKLVDIAAQVKSRWR